MRRLLRYGSAYPVEQNHIMMVVGPAWLGGSKHQPINILGRSSRRSPRTPRFPGLR